MRRSLSVRVGVSDEVSVMAGVREEEGRDEEGDELGRN